MLPAAGTRRLRAVARAWRRDLRSGVCRGASSVARSAGARGASACRDARPRRFHRGVGAGWRRGRAMRTDAALRAILPAIVDCYDCADFWLVPLLWCRAKFGDAIAADITRGDRPRGPRVPLLDGRARQRRDVVFQREPRTALPRRLLSRRFALPDATFVRSGRKGAQQAEIGRARVHAWFDRFEADELAEWNSAPYFPIDFKGLAALAALAPDARCQSPRRARDPAAPGDRRALQPPRHAHRVAGAELRAFALPGDDAGAFVDRAALLRARRVRLACACVAAACASCA